MESYNGMQEAEVILRLAMYHILNGLTDKTVKVSIDGAHIKVKDDVIFDIRDFAKKNNIIKTVGSEDSYKGTYRIKGYVVDIIVDSKSGIGDVNIVLNDRKTLYAECKKGKVNKSSSEYSLMREAIGQLMTGCELTEDMIPVVAVPYTEKTYKLANKWVKYQQMKKSGIKFYLVKTDGDIVIV